MDFGNMDLTTLGIGILGLLLIFGFFKFLVKLPFYIMTFAILGALGYAVYMYILPMLN